MPPVVPDLPDLPDDVATLRRSLRLVDHGLATTLGRVRVVAERGIALHGPSWVVACSGGADSALLLLVLERLRRRLGLTLTVAHVDHGLRAASAREGALVERLAQALDVPFRARVIALRGGAGLAVRARDARHAALDECAAEVGATAVALGHTATDRAETVLLNLARGAGLQGLAAMPAVSPRRVRPLVELTREEVRALAVRVGLPFVDDPTNERVDLPRTAVRHRVLPVLDELHEGADRRIASTSAELEDVVEAIATWARRELDLRTIRGDEQADATASSMPDMGNGAAHGAVALSVEGWSDLPRAVRTQILRTFLVQRGVDEATLGRGIVLAVDAACARAGMRPERSPSSSDPRIGELTRKDRAVASAMLPSWSWAVRPSRHICVRQGTLVVFAHEFAASDPSGRPDG